MASAQDELKNSVGLDKENEDPDASKLAPELEKENNSESEPKDVEVEHESEGNY